MDQYVDFLSKNHWFIVVASLCSVVGVIGVPLAIYYYFKSKRERKPRYAMRSITIIDGAQKTIPALTVRFDGYDEPITDLTVTKLAFWNDGREAIRTEDVVEEVNVRLVDGAILDATVVQNVTEANGFTVAIDPRKIIATISFRYIDYNEGAVVQLLHTGRSDRLYVNWRFIGAGRPVRMFLSKSPQNTAQVSPKVARRIAIAACILVPLLVAVGIYNGPISQGQKFPLLNSILNGTLLTVVIVFCAILLYFIWNWRVPSHLDKFFQDF